MKIMKRLAALVLVLCLFATMLPVDAQAASVYNGTCGDNLYWNLSSAGGVLYIFGTGPMDNWDGIYEQAPWNWMYLYTPIKKIIIEEGITSIGSNAFTFCHELTNILIPDSVTIIGTGAFYGCENLKSVTLGKRIATVGVEAFRGCTSLEHIELPDSVISIGSKAFYNCSSLVSITIGNNVTSIGSSAFDGSYVFYRGTKDKSYSISGDIPYYAQWHYEVTEMDGVELAYHCGECNKNYWWDGSESLFTDVLTNNWQFTFAKYAVEQNLMAGTGTDEYGRVTFVPNKSITREEFVQVLYNAEGKPSVTIANKFPDVANNGWYKNAVFWANENNIASGMGNGNFGVGKNITRQDLALMLYKYAALRGCSLDATTGSIYQYADGTSVSGYAKTAMDWAVTNGILSGKGTAGKPIYTFRLDPAGTATRAECAAMLKNFRTAFRICAHVNLQATVAKPATCTEMGNIDYWCCDDCNRYFSDGEAAVEILPENIVIEATGHSWVDATCTEPKTCTKCGITTGFEAGHRWKAATCTEPERCTVCNETQGSALGHYMLFTQCMRNGCDHIDFSCIAGTYTNIGGYGVPVGTTTMVDLNVTNVSVSDSGEFSFTYNGKSFTLTLRQNDESDQFMAYFDCYLNGELVENVDFRAGSELYDNRIYLDEFVVDNCKIYLMATR